MSESNYSLKRSVETSARKSQTLYNIVNELCQKRGKYLNKDNMRRLFKHGHTIADLHAGIKDINDSIDILTQYKTLVKNEKKRREKTDEVCANINFNIG
jgi:hypothetical protein